MNKVLPLILLTTWLTGCTESGPNETMNADEVVIAYQANVDDQGGCRPTYDAVTLQDQDGLSVNKLYMIEGDTEYFLQDGRKIGEIPFQVKVNRRETVSLLNEVVACKDLQIKVTVEECKYEFGTERDGCPPIIVKGQESFADISFIVL